MWGSILGGLASAVGGSLMSGNAPTANVPPGQPAAAANTFGDISSLNNPYPAMQPLEMQQLEAMMNNPNIANYLSAARTAGQASTGSGNLLMNEAGGLYNQAYDPQNALKKQMESQVQDQSNVNNAMYGLQSSPYGAGVANKNLSDFDIAWQNNQLAREAQANPLIGQDLGAAVQAYQGGGAIPYDAYGQVTGDVSNAIDRYMTGAGAGNTLTQNQIGDFLQYMGMGQSGVGLNQTAYGMNQNTAAAGAAGLTPLMDYSFGKLFSSPSTTTTPPNSTPPVNLGDTSQYNLGVTF